MCHLTCHMTGWRSGTKAHYSTGSVAVFFRLCEPDLQTLFPGVSWVIYGCHGLFVVTPSHHPCTTIINITRNGDDEQPPLSHRSPFRGSPMFSARFRTSHDFRHPFPPVSAFIIGFRNIFRIRFPQVMIHPNGFRATRLYLSVLWLFVLLLIILVANN